MPLDYNILHPLCLVCIFHSMSANGVELQLCKGESMVTRVKKM